MDDVAAAQVVEESTGPCCLRCIEPFRWLVLELCQLEALVDVDAIEVDTVAACPGAKKDGHVELQVRCRGARGDC